MQPFPSNLPRVTLDFPLFKQTPHSQTPSASFKMYPQSLFSLLLTPLFIQIIIVVAQRSPDGTCGLVGAGNNNGYNCLSDQPCCSASGYCGSGDSYCLTSTGCQSPYSYQANAETPSLPACYAPVDGQTLSPDNTCGKNGAGVFGYRCHEPLRCCST